MQLIAGLMLWLCCMGDPSGIEGRAVPQGDPCGVCVHQYVLCAEDAKHTRERAWDCCVRDLGPWEEGSYPTPEEVYDCFVPPILAWQEDLAGCKDQYQECTQDCWEPTRKKDDCLDPMDGCVWKCKVHYLIDMLWCQMGYDIHVEACMALPPGAPEHKVCLEAAQVGLKTCRAKALEDWKTCGQECRYDKEE